MKSILFMSVLFMIGATASMTAYADYNPPPEDFIEPRILSLEVVETPTRSLAIEGIVFLKDGYDTILVYQEYNDYTNIVTLEADGSFYWVYQEYRDKDCQNAKPKFLPITVTYVEYSKTVTGVYKSPHP